MPFIIAWKGQYVNYVYYENVPKINWEKVTHFLKKLSFLLDILSILLYDVRV
jgi:hypothetical protein